MQTIFLGTPAFAVPSLRDLVAAGYAPSLVVTRPDKPRGRGLHVQPSAVKAAATELGLPVESPPKFHDPEFLARLQGLKPDVFVIVAYGVILKAAALGIPRLGSINLHASLLPRWRGVAPIAWQIYSGDTEAGVSTQWIDAGIDTGVVIHRDAFPMPSGATTGSLTEELALRGARLLARTLREVEAGTAPREAQEASAATHAPPFRKEDGRVDWTWPAARIERTLRAFDPWPGLKFQLGPEGVRIRRARAEAGPWAASAGVVLSVGAAGVRVACGEGALLLQTVQPDGKQAMAADAWARGRGVAPGTVLTGTAS